MLSTLSAIRSLSLRKTVVISKLPSFSTIRHQSTTTTTKNESAGAEPDLLIHEALIHHQKPDIAGSSLAADDVRLPLLEEGIRKSDELTSNFTDYMFRFNRLPPNFASNQFMSLDQELQRELTQIMDNFDAPIRYAFGYGSGVFEQKGYETGDSSPLPQIDMIFGVTYPEHFHSLNMRQNPHHYSTLKYFGSKFVSKFQEIGAGIYFNPFVEINGHEVKYGVVSMKRLLKDLATWDSFYLAGRLQKPVKILKNDLRVQYWNQLNLKAAATLAKHLTLKRNKGKFDEFQFYKEITGLSYLGDIRYTLGGENPNKVHNIVEKNFERFQLYYKPIYKDVIINNSTYLPKGYTVDNATRILRGRISKSSVLQTLKGVLTAGVSKSVRYAWAKKMKSFKK
ncbi:hypothetical protein NCAS_0B01420 [Naumovozyma castellii]|uniref:Phosphatidate cytidylyltransferase, mitochondrial n=1 Tax=Naumovozyma castellii TaxID=27288 RepID=G0VBA2_NAUCA|nr:hypothetical protein NCAS_0B01420 [Naumovozyma castellii CBS 4309]CCC68226.1 hypothetical protein NCAS_0B01420 [Naumovozyma castellii CBS 4309]